MIHSELSYINDRRIRNRYLFIVFFVTWWRHKMETFSALLALCAGNSPATGEFPSQRPVTRSFDVFFDLRLDKRLSKPSWPRWFEKPSCSVWRHCDENGRRRPVCWQHQPYWTDAGGPIYQSIYILARKSTKKLYAIITSTDATLTVQPLILANNKGSI